MIDQYVNSYLDCVSTACKLWDSPWSNAHIRENLKYSTHPQVIHIDQNNDLLIHREGKEYLTFIPPQAGHTPYIVDFGPEQSLIQCALQNLPIEYGIASIHQLPAGKEYYGIESSIVTLDNIVCRLGRKVHLVGLCQGGWQAAIYNALFPKRVISLTIAGSPIDFHAGNGMVMKMALGTPMEFYEEMVALGGGNMPGTLILFGFMLMNAYERFVGDEVDLLLSGDKDERFRRFHNWYKRPQPVPGEFYLQAVRRLFKENQLVRKKFDILGNIVDLSNIKNPVYLIAGIKDDITPPEQVWALERQVQGKVRKFLVEAGHIGLFMAKKVLTDVWAPLFKEIVK